MTREEYWTACFDAAYRSARQYGDSERVAHRKAYDEAVENAREFEEETGVDHETS